MNQYEIMFIIAAALEDDRKAELVEMVKGIISNGGGELAKSDIWGLRKLAYPILKKNDGYYVVMEFSAPPELPKELDRRLKILDDIIRHLIINKNEK